MIFLHPQLLWGAPAVLLLGTVLYGWSRRIRRRRLVLFTTFEETAALLSSRQETARLTGHGLLVLGLVFLVIALARPLVGPKSIEAEREGIDVLVAIDISKSMLVTDVAPRRLEAARTAVLHWLRGRANDRVGLILFAGDSFLQIPLTSDHAAVAALLESVHPTGRGGSNLENPIQTAINVFSRTTGKSRALILVTDGENLEGEPVARAAEAFQRHGIRVQTLGVGTTSGGKVPNIVGRGAIGGEVRNSYGMGVVSKLDATQLRAIATAGGGAYYGLADDSDALDQLQRRQLDPLLRDTRVIDATDYEEWFILPLLAGLLCFVAERFTPRVIQLRAPALLLAALLALITGAPRAEAQPSDLARYEALIKDGRTADALAGLHEAATQHPADPFTLYNLGIVSYSTKDYVAASKAFETLLALPDDRLRAKALVQLGNVHARLGEALLADGREAAAAVEFELALTSYENPAAGGRGLSKNSKVTETVYLDSLEHVADEQFTAGAAMADNWTQRRMLQKALGAIDQVLARDPKRATALKRDTETRALLVGNITSAGREKLTAGEKTMAAGRFKDAYVPMREAYELANSALELSPDDPRARAFHTDSRLAFSSMLVTKAREEFDDALKTPKLANRLGKLGSAESRIEEALSLDPDNVPARELGALIRTEIEKTALADGDTLVKAADAAKSPAGIAVNLTQAITRFQRVLEVNPANTHAQEQLTAILPRLAEAMTQMGEAELAAAKKSIAGEKSPTAAQIRTALDHLGKADEALGQASAAGMDQQRLKPLVGEVHALAEKLQTMLEKLGGDAAPPPPPAPKPEDAEGSPGDPKGKEANGEGEPKPETPKTFADIRKAGHGARQPPPEKDW